MAVDAYDNLSVYYDAVQKDVDTDAWACYLYELIQQFGTFKKRKGEQLLLCDLGCGTGNMAIALSSKGFDIIGVDQSIGMLDEARQKAERQKEDMLFLHQDITRLDLYGSVHVFTCLLDTFNHLRDIKAIKRMLLSFDRYLEPGGLFIFDVLTSNYFASVASQPPFFSIDDDHALLWQYKLNQKKDLCKVDITLFSRDHDDLYRRQEIVVAERIYNDDVIVGLLSGAGLDLCGRFMPMTKDVPEKMAHRVFYVARRPFVLGVQS